MPAKASQGAALSVEQIQLLCQVVQHSESPRKESWDVIAQKLGITNGNAAQQRFGRLLKTLKSVDPTGNSDGGSPKPKTTGKRAASGRQNGNTVKKAKANTMHAEEGGEEGEDEDEPGEEETPSKKYKSEKQGGTPKWKSIFERDDDVVKVEDDEDVEYGASRIKVKNVVDGEVVN